MRDYDVENPMTIDSVWDRMDELEREYLDNELALEADREYDDLAPDRDHDDWPEEEWRGWKYENGFFL